MNKMLEKYKIGVLCGGLSQEREVSLRSGEAVFQAIKKLGYKCCKIDVTRDAAALIKDAEIDLAYIVLHGKYGEDGCIQGLLEILDIPYTGSGVMASSIAMNKVTTKRILLSEGFKTPGYMIITKKNIKNDCEQALMDIGLPMVIKPVAEGSSISVSIIKKEGDLQTAAEAILHEYDGVFVEKFINGKEITTGVLGSYPESEALPVLQLVSKNEFYDYEAKYTKGLTEFILPADLEKSIYAAAQKTAVEVHDVLGCRSVSRVDAIVDEENNIWVIEVNTLPGMTATSDLPAQAKEAGIGFEELVERILFSVVQNR